MKIKYIANVRLPSNKAASFAIMKMCSEFSKKNIEVELIVPSRKNTEIKNDPFDYYHIEKNFEIKRIQSFDLLGLTYKLGLLFYWIDIVSFIAALKLKVRFSNDDVIYTRDFIIPLFFKSKKTCLELHSIPKSRFLFKMALKKVGRFIVLTNNIKKILLDFGVEEKDIIIAPSAVDMDEYKNLTEIPKIQGLNAGDFVFGYIGTLRTMGEEKGVYNGLEALTLLPNNFKFLVGGGEQDEIDYYKELSVKMGVSNKVIFVGKIDRKDKYSYGSLCDVLIAPFPDIEHYRYYMSPLKIFEYMANKKPIITSNLPSLNEILTNGQNSILISPDDSKALADAIEKLKNNPELSKTLSENAYNDVVTKYTWGSRTEKIVSFINI